MTHIDPFLKKTVDSIHVSSLKPSFLHELCSKIRKKSPFSSQTVQSLFEDSAHQIRQRSLVIAELLVDSSLKNLDKFLDELKQWGYSLNENATAENEHLEFLRRRVLDLINSKKLVKQVLSLRIPLMNAHLESIIRIGLQLSPKTPIQNKHIQVLCLSAFFTPLRQTIGSCFATAPAILVQEEQPSLFFQDLEDLLNIGLLKRTFSGEELSIPLSSSWGQGFIDRPFTYREKEEMWNRLELRELANFSKPKTKECLSESEIKDLYVKKLGLKDSHNFTLRKLLQMLLKKERKNNVDLEISKHNSFEKANFSMKITTSDEIIEREFEKGLQYLIQIEDHPLLKAWEYTVASFAESKSDFYKWNLYASLGFDSKEDFGIGQSIYQYLNENRNTNQLEIERLDEEYQQEFFRVKSIERKLVNAEDNNAASWMRFEYQSHIQDLNRSLFERDSLIEKTNRLGEFLPKIIKSFDRLFPQYFQELYDAEMQDYKKEIYEDSPAGFRLVYKHGRADPSLWSFISNSETFQSALKDFFTFVENEIITREEFKGLEREISEIITQIIRLIQSDEFMLYSFRRVCARYNYPISKESHLDALPYKPWAYISGGTLTGLLKNYFKRDVEFKVESKKVATETELFAFYIDVLRELPEDEIKKYERNRYKSLLSYSPNHAFLFCPGKMPLAELWNKEVYAFTWIRDEFVLPQNLFQESIEVLPSQCNHFLETYLSQSPYLLMWFKENVLLPNYPLNIRNFSDLLTKNLSKAPHNFEINSEKIEGWVYEFFPLISSNQVSGTIKLLINGLALDFIDDSKLNSVIEILSDTQQKTSWISSLELFYICKAALVILHENEQTQENLQSKLLEVMRLNKLAMPKPICFGDTNWPKFQFGFLVNPSNSQLELWRFDSIARSGFPIKAWKKFFNPKAASEWSVLINAHEYTAPHFKFL
ncbi:MAG: hypothetical protein S4CHLAM7_10840 [Chlamydiae bacterium]|nr:hypothetical protein [Chlamydiota bacterium]